MCKALTFLHSHCGCTSYDLQVCAKLPQRCPSCPPPGTSKYIIQPNWVPSFIPESLSSCPSFDHTDLTKIHPLPCQHHLKKASPKARRRIILRSPPPSPSDSECPNHEGLFIDASGKPRNSETYPQTDPVIEMSPWKDSKDDIEPEPRCVGLSERYCSGEWRERTVAEILEDGRAEERGVFDKERVEPGKLEGPRPWYSPCRWVWGKC